ncbi:hypothetical protein LSH36_223g00008 [Paralvinella palmiformis]|uniref:Protein FAM219A n=1 Tax=Paralvinella palmiformis TaxID=53620 RepID=A0AAD9JMX7_9ANNE|nr:hypothetical protein LSH36_223g00008 [Paralvinella palmiformis]
MVAKITPTSTTTSTITSLKKPSLLQKKLEKQHEACRRQHVTIEQPFRKGILSRNRLSVPNKGDAVISASDMQPLVMLSDDSEDEFAVPDLSHEAHMEITQQLIKDGYNLDLVPDDEDLDLIPPRPLNERCVCCPSSTILSGLSSTTCSIQ